MGWVGFDLDGTLATWNSKDEGAIERVGDPIPGMVDRAKDYLRKRIEVRIVTARVSPVDHDYGDFVERQRAMIQDWCEEVFGVRLQVTHEKDFKMWKLYDDRTDGVVANAGVLKTDKAWDDALEAAAELAEGHGGADDLVDAIRKLKVIGT